MVDEYIDIVDEQNNLTDQKELRSMIHSTGLWHRTVHVYLFRKKENRFEFLVHLRSKDKDLHPNHWDTRFGGHITAGQTIDEGAREEIKEELSLDLDRYKLFEGKWVKEDQYPNREFSKVFYLEFTDDVSILKFDDGEVQEVKWMSADEVGNSLESDKEAWAGSKEGFEDIYKSLVEKY